MNHSEIVSFLGGVADLIRPSSDLPRVLSPRVR
jgi:hypothetical protein